LRAGDDRAAKDVRRDDVRDRRLAEKRGDLAEELAASEGAVVLAAHPDRRLALEDDVERRAADALTDDPLAFGVPALLDDVGDRLELSRADVREQRDAGQGLG